MSEAGPILLVGATGVVGLQVIGLAARVPGLALVALARRSVTVPGGTRVEVAEPRQWEAAVRRLGPAAVICALGTTWRKAGRDEAAFRAVDHDLVLTVARAACETGAGQFVLVSSVGADPRGATFYLKVKGETEAAVNAMEFDKVDVLRPGLLRAQRTGERRFGERAAILASPVTDRLLHGLLRRYRSIDVRAVAAAALQCTREGGAGRFVHEHDAILAAARRWEQGA